MVVSRPALHAPQAYVEQLQRHAVPRLEAGHTLAQRRHLPGALVAQHEAWRHGEFAAEEVEVAAADADAAHPDQHLAVAGNWPFRFEYLERTRLREGGLFHHALQFGRGVRAWVPVIMRP